jgi:hypothetical protein
MLDDWFSASFLQIAGDNKGEKELPMARALNARLGRFLDFSFFPPTIMICEPTSSTAATVLSIEFHPARNYKSTHRHLTRLLVGYIGSPSYFSPFPVRITVYYHFNGPKFKDPLYTVSDLEGIYI